MPCHSFSCCCAVAYLNFASKLSCCCFQQLALYMVLLVIFKPCIRFRWSLYRFQLKSSNLSSDMLGLPRWCHVHCFSSVSNAPLLKHLIRICTSYLAFHDMSCIMFLVHCTVINYCSVVCGLVLSRAGRRVRERGYCRVRLQGASFRQPKNIAGKMIITPDVTSIFAC